MTPDKFNHLMPPPAKRRGANPYVLFAGVAGACALGAGLGLWARPAMNERQMAVATPGDVVKAIKAAAPIRRLQIVVDDGPAPIGAPIEVLSAASARPAPVAQPASPPDPELQTPVRPPEGLMQVRSVAPPDPAPTQPEPAPAPPKLVVAKAKPAAPPAHLSAVHQTPASLAEAAPALLKTQKIELASAARARAEAAKAAKAEAHRIELAKTAEAKAQRIELAKAAKAEAHRIELAKAAEAKAQRTELAKAAKAEAHRVELAKAAKAEAHRIELASAAEDERQERLRLAKAEAKGRAEARAEAKAEALAQAQQEVRRQTRLASLAHAPVRAPPHASSHAAKTAPAVELAKLDRRLGRKARRDGQVEQAAARKPARVAEPAYRPRPLLVAPQPHPGLMTVSTSPRCANRDPGAALVCADPILGAVERQLARAYQGAIAAGVPDAQLQRQQQHWLASRLAAARDAPWAIHDVYLARIAELNGMAKDAHGGGH